MNKQFQNKEQKMLTLEIVNQETIKAARERHDAYLASLSEHDFSGSTETIQPNEMKIGDHMMQHGCVYKIDEIRIFQDRGDDIPVYVALGTYVSGNIQMYKMFLASTQNGCARDYRTSQQGNARARWTRVTKQGED